MTKKSTKHTVDEDTGEAITTEDITSEKMEPDRHEDPWVEIADKAMTDGLMGVCLQEIKAAPDVWQKLGAQEQEDIIYRVEMAVRSAVRRATRIIESEGRNHAFARVEYVKFKDGEATAVLKGRADDHMHLIADAAGPILLILSENDRSGEGHTHRADDDQGALDLPSGDDFNIPAPSDDASDDDKGADDDQDSEDPPAGSDEVPLD